jgi:Ca-activated chloride channel family protein
MKATAAILAAALWCGTGTLGGARGQETQAEPQPAGPTPAQTKPEQQDSTAQKKPAPVERRASKPDANAEAPVAGPLTKTTATGAGQQVQAPIERSGDTGTIRVQARLVDVALNVVDAKGAPVGGFEKKDFQLFEDGKPQTIAVFEREATSPLSIVLAIDSSMTVLTSDRLEKEAAKHFVRAILREQDELDLMDFSDTVREIVSFTNQQKRVEQGLGQLQQGDETALYNAIYLASQRLGTTSQAANRRRVLVVISDGGDQIEKGVRYEAAVEQAQRVGAIIYSIIVVPIAADAGRNTGGEHAMIQLSEDTGGKYYYVEDPSDLEPAFRHVSDDLRTQYLLGYYPPLGGDTAFRRIKVKLTDAAADEKYSLRYRTGYYADGK